MPKVTRIIDEKSQPNWYMTEKLTYLIQTYDTDQGEDANTFEVTRSFSDFSWLQEQLKKKYPGTILPGLPCKTILAKLNKNLGYFLILVDQIQSDLLEERRYCLQMYISSLHGHEQLIQDECIHSFLYDNEIFESIRKSSESDKSSVEETITQTLSKGFNFLQGFISNKKRIDTPTDEKYKQKQEKLQQREKNINDLSDSINKIIQNYKQRQQALENISHIFENFQSNDQQGLKDVISIVNESSYKIQSLEFDSTQKLLSKQIYKSLLEDQFIRAQKFLQNVLRFKINCLAYPINFNKLLMAQLFQTKNKQREIENDIQDLTKRYEKLEKNIDKDYDNFEQKTKKQLEEYILKYHTYSQSIVKQTNEVYDQSMKSYNMNVNNIN